MAVFQQRHFAFRHPLFKSKKSASGVWFEDSIYHLWWEFLRRHEGYKRTCENGGRGQYAKLYADFGDVHSMKFKEWWTKADRGARLFAEPVMPHSVTTISPRDVDALSDAWTSGAMMVIAIPLSLPKRFISQKTAKLLRQNNPRKRGQRMHKESKAHYPIETSFNIPSLKKTLGAFDLHQAEPHLTLWQIAQELKLGTQLTKEELGRGKGVNKKSILSVAASKKLKSAQKIIDGVGKGIFPAISSGKKKK